MIDFSQTLNATLRDIYVILDKDAGEFSEIIRTKSDETIETLRQMLVSIDPGDNGREVALITLGLAIIANRLKLRPQ